MTLSLSDIVEAQPQNARQPNHLSIIDRWAWRLGRGPPAALGDLGCAALLTVTVNDTVDRLLASARPGLASVSSLDTDGCLVCCAVRTAACAA